MIVLSSSERTSTRDRAGEARKGRAAHLRVVFWRSHALSGGAIRAVSRGACRHDFRYGDFPGLKRGKYVRCQKVTARVLCDSGRAAALFLVVSTPGSGSSGVNGNVAASFFRPARTFKRATTTPDNFFVSNIPIVLVIDDDAQFVEFIASIMESENCRAVVATDGFTGLLLAREVRPRLILCDYVMPGVDGEHVLEVLRDDPVTADVPRVLMSGHGCPDLRKIPADAFIAKPIDTQALRRLVRAFTRAKSVAAK